MAQDNIDPSNLKSFQRISLEDARYLKELGKAIAFARAHAGQSSDSEGQKAETKKESFDWMPIGLLPGRLFELLKSSVDKMLYETVPTHEVYASRE
jgi:hypothetical protein